MSDFEMIIVSIILGYTVGQVLIMLFVFIKWAYKKLPVDKYVTWKRKRKMQQMMDNWGK